MKKRLVKLFTVVCCISVLLGVVFLNSCKQKEQDSESVSDNRISIMEGGITNYKIVRSEDASEAEKAAVVALHGAIKEATGVDIETTTDMEIESLGIVRTDYEILVGQTNRDENPSPLYSDYGFTMPTTRVCIYGGSAEALELAVEEFIAQCVSESGISLPKDGFTYIGNYPMRNESVGGIDLVDLKEIVYYYDTMVEPASELADSLGKLVGNSLNVKKGTKSSKCAILLGCDKADKRVQELGEDQWFFQADDDKILIATNGGTGKTATKMICQAFLNEILEDSAYMNFLSLKYTLTYSPIEVPINGTVLENVRAVPEDIYEEPYRESQYTTVYAPWLKMYHILSEEEAAAGLNGADGCQLIRSFDVSPVDKNVMYMITDTTGVWKTTDGGQLWYNVTNNIPDVYGASVFCDRKDVNTVYAYIVPSGVYRSTDGGRNWTKLISDSTDYRSFNAGRFAQDDAGNTYIAASSGIYKLEAGSDKLINLYSKYNDLIGNESTLFGDIYVSGDGQDIYVAGAYSSGYIASSSCYVSGLYISNDGGATWEIKNIYKEFDSSATGSSVLSITVDPANENRILVLSMKYDTATKKEGGTTELFESLDGGKSFVHVGNCSYALQIRIGPKNASGVSPIYVQRGNDATFKGLQVSYDGGKTFSAMVSDAHSMRENTWYEGNGNGHYGYWFEPFVIDYTKEDTIYTAAYGIQKYEKGTWTWIGAGFSGASVIQYTMDDNGNMILIMTDVGVSISTAPYTEDSYATFERAYTEVLTMIAVDPNNSKHIIGFTGANNTAAGKQLGIVISNNGGQTFGGIVAAATRNTAVLEYVGNNTIYTSEYYSTDNGNTWKKTKYFIYDICDADPNRMIAIDKTNNMVMLSTNGGSTWTAVVELKFADAYIDLDMMRFDVANKNKVWYSDIRSFGYIDLATNTKVDLVSKFEYKNFTYFAQNPNNPDHIIVTTLYAYSNAVKDPKVYETRDGGKTWHVVPGFFGGYTQSVFFSKTTDEVFIGGHMGTMIYDYKAYWEYLDKQ